MIINKLTPQNVSRAGTYATTIGLVIILDNLIDRSWLFMLGMVILVMANGFFAYLEGFHAGIEATPTNGSNE